MVVRLVALIIYLLVKLIIGLFITECIIIHSTCTKALGSRFIPRLSPFLLQLSPRLSPFLTHFINTLFLNFFYIINFYFSFPKPQNPKAKTPKPVSQNPKAKTRKPKPQNPKAKIPFVLELDILKEFIILYLIAIKINFHFKCNFLYVN